MSAYSFVSKFIVQRFIPGAGRELYRHAGKLVLGAWKVFPSSVLTNPLEGGDWERLAPLRINVFSDKMAKAGVATSPQELRFIFEQMGSRAKVPYHVGKRADRDHKLRKSTFSRDPSVVFGPQRSAHA